MPGFKLQLTLFVLFLYRMIVTPKLCSPFHGCQQIADNSPQSAVFIRHRGKYRLQKCYFWRCFRKDSLCLYIWTSFPKSSIDMSKVTVIRLHSVIKHEHAARLPGRFCSALSQHHIIPLIWSHFAWLHPGRLPVGAQQGRQLDRRSLLYGR